MSRVQTVQLFINVSGPTDAHLQQTGTLLKYGTVYKMFHFQWTHLTNTDYFLLVKRFLHILQSDSFMVSLKKKKKNEILSLST